MKDNGAQSLSPWMASATVPAFGPLTEDANADVCVVGAGIAGMTTAYPLARRGQSVVVLDDGPIAGGQTRRTTAHLSNAIDDRYFEIERRHGGGGARLVAEGHTAAIDRIEAIVRAEQIACDFERLDGYLSLPPGGDPEALDRELTAAHRAGLAGVGRLPRAPLAPFDTGPCLRFPGQGRFHPLRYLAGLARAIGRDGGRTSPGPTPRVSMAA
jgi:glycine/D-amino acid oxidase-like deaminating enzyme